jgi:hypothetical protein
MSTETVNPEHEKLLEVLKFTPRTYKIYMWGYGGEKVMGTVDRKIYDYFKSRRLDLSDYCWDSDYAEENNIPEDMQPFAPGAWYDCDDMAHAAGVSRSAGTLQIDDENGETVYQRSFDEIAGWNDADDEPVIECFSEAWVGSKPAGTVVFLGCSNEKGTFFEGEINLTAPFDITKLKLISEDIDEEEIVNMVEYDGETIDNWGGNTDGKSSDFGFYLVKSSNSWDRYRSMDDIEYEMTPWFPKKIEPVRVGNYLVRTAGKNSYTYQAHWTGTHWTSAYSEDEIKIKEWQGIAYDPDEQDLHEELAQIHAEFINPKETV